MSREADSGIAVLGAFVLGGLVGAAVALLTAPKTGKETREDLYNWTEGAARRTRETAQRVAGEAGERVKGFAGEAQGRVRDLASDAGEKVRGAYSSARERFGSAHAEEDAPAPATD